jgi:hypothetical protein
MKATKMVRYADDLVDAPRCWDRGSGPSNGRHSTDSMKRIGQPTRSRLFKPWRYGRHQGGTISIAGTTPYLGGKLDQVVTSSSLGS